MFTGWVCLPLVVELCSNGGSGDFLAWLRVGAMAIYRVAARRKQQSGCGLLAMMQALDSCECNRLTNSRLVAG